MCVKAEHELKVAADGLSLLTEAVDCNGPDWSHAGTNDSFLDVDRQRTKPANLRTRPRFAHAAGEADCYDLYEKNRLC